MNGAECGECGHIACKCKEIARNIRRRERFEAESELIKQMHQAITKTKIRGLHFKVLKWLWPEIGRMADKIKEYCQTKECNK